jgi:predicted DNA binding protein
MGRNTPTVTVEKVARSKGDRLAIAVEETADRITLDALALESLTWQDPSFVADLDNDSRFAADSAGGSIAASERELRVINEYSQIEVGLVSGDPDRFAVRDSEGEYRIELTPAQLAVLAAEDDIGFVTDILSETPFGPDI